MTTEGDLEEIFNFYAGKLLKFLDTLQIVQNRSAFYR